MGIFRSVLRLFMSEEARKKDSEHRRRMAEMDRSSKMFEDADKLVSDLNKDEDDSTLRELEELEKQDK
jgi:hypothetical protein